MVVSHAESFYDALKYHRYDRLFRINEHISSRSHWETYETHCVDFCKWERKGNQILTGYQLSIGHQLDETAAILKPKCHNGRCLSIGHQLDETLTDASLDYNDDHLKNINININIDLLC